MTILEMEDHLRLLPQVPYIWVDKVKASRGKPALSVPKLLVPLVLRIRLDTFAPFHCLGNRTVCYLVDPRVCFFSLATVDLSSAVGDRHSLTNGEFSRKCTNNQVACIPVNSVRFWVMSLVHQRYNYTEATSSPSLGAKPSVWSRPASEPTKECFGSCPGSFKTHQPPSAFPSFAWGRCVALAYEDYEDEAFF